MYSILAVIHHLGNANQGHYLTYVMDDERLLRLNDLSVEVAIPADLATIERHCILLLYKFEHMLDKADALEMAESSAMISDIINTKLKSRQRRKETRKKQPMRKHTLVRYQERSKSVSDSYKS